MTMCSKKIQGVEFVICKTVYDHSAVLLYSSVTGATRFLVIPGMEWFLGNSCYGVTSFGELILISDRIADKEKTAAWVLCVVFRLDVVNKNNRMEDFVSK